MEEPPESLSMQLCNPSNDGDYTFGLMASGTGDFASIQEALQTWSKGKCLSSVMRNIVNGPVSYASYPATEHVNVNTTNVNSAKVNSANVNSTIRQHVCCSPGTMPDFSPKPNPDGSCATYTVSAGDNCASIGAKNSLTNSEIESFNKNTWGWTSCDRILAGSVMCLSKGKPPMPSIISNAVCGPQKPGTEAPPDGTDISKLNPCPLNACCNVWGQCGITADFCTNTTTGAPGTAKEGTNGCISNCGTDIVPGDSSITTKRIAYYEGYSLGSRECLYQDITQLDLSRYTHVHFSFATLTADYKPLIGDKYAQFEFQLFKQLIGVKRILTFGGWEFSTSPSTYNIFREGVKPANAHVMATNIADFIKQHDLDGVDIDWEYPGAPDIPGIPASDKDEGNNFKNFLILLKDLLKDKSVAIAAPSSFWYLKNIPIEEIGSVVDYVVLMTYDFHGQWDAGNRYSQEGCPSGMCLRSHVNMTETLTSLSMITKAGVASQKVVVGVTSYGRSFDMADPNCHGPNCLYTGTAVASNAKPGRCTKVAGYIADAEINEMYDDKQKSGRVKMHYFDSSSQSDIVIYDNNQWAAYMSSETKSKREALYDSLKLGGSSDWATDLQKFNPAPWPDKSWTQRRLRPYDYKAAQRWSAYIWNSVVNLHLMYQSLYNVILDARTHLSTSLEDIENKFGPVKEESSKWLDALIDIVSAGTSAIVSDFFKLTLKNMISLADSTKEVAGRVGDVFIQTGVDQAKGLVQDHT
ncbi:hypothetical protein KEM55_003850, partial [Ascosphaera atra]